MRPIILDLPYRGIEGPLARFPQATQSGRLSRGRWGISPPRQVAGKTPAPQSGKGTIVSLPVSELLTMSGSIEHRPFSCRLLS